MQKVVKLLPLMIALAVAMNIHALTLQSPTDLTLVVSPKSPRAGETFRVEAKSFAFDRLRANFRWFRDAKLVASGVGLVEQEFAAGILGSAMNIRAVATSEEGLSYEANIAVFIADIDFIIHPLTYTPSFYRGAALATPGSEVEIVAIPHLFRSGVRILPQSLIYDWEVDRKPVQNQSGGGKNKLTLALPDIGSGNYDISLKVSTLDGTISAEKSLFLKTFEPQLIFYETSPLTGMRPLALSAFFGRAGDTFSILAEPYFFALGHLKNAKTTWNANGVNLETPASTRLLEVSAPVGSESESVFNFIIEAPRTIFQRAEASLSVKAAP